jgi:hypothetical protein
LHRKPLDIPQSKPTGPLLKTLSQQLGEVKYTPPVIPPAIQKALRREIPRAILGTPPAKRVSAQRIARILTKAELSFGDLVALGLDPVIILLIERLSKPETAPAIKASLLFDIGPDGVKHVRVTDDDATALGDAITRAKRKRTNKPSRKYRAMNDGVSA